MKGDSIWDIESIDDIMVPEILMENAKMGIARIQFEALKVKELQKMNGKLDELISVFKNQAQHNVKQTKGTGGVNV